MSVRRNYYFTVELWGAGTTPDEAWEHVIEQLSNDGFGAVPDQFIVEDRDSGEDDADGRDPTPKEPLNAISGRLSDLKKAGLIVETEFTVEGCRFLRVAEE